MESYNHGNEIPVEEDVDDDAKLASSESSFFVEAEEVFSLLEEIASIPLTDDDGSNLHDVNDYVKILNRLRMIWDKYLECPSLLDPFLERMAHLLSDNAKAIIQDIYESNNRNGFLNDDKERNETDIISKQSIQEQPKSIFKLQLLLSCIYALSKVRGSKHIQRFLSHDAADLEPVLFMLRLFIQRKKTYDEAQQNIKSTTFQHFNLIPMWESIYSLLLWMGMLSLVPFDLNTIDSSISQQQQQQGQGVTTLISSMLQTAKNHLTDSGTTRDIASSTLASLLSRPDLEHKELESFVSWSNKVLEIYYQFHHSPHYSHDTDNHSSHDDNTNDCYYDDLKTVNATSITFLVMGVVQTLAAIFKTGNRSNLMTTRHLKSVEILWERAILISETASPTTTSNAFSVIDNSTTTATTTTSSSSSGGALLLRKLLVKLFARVGCSYLPPRVASWRYQRGRRSLLENLANSNQNSSSSTSSDSDNDNSDGCIASGGLDSTVHQYNDDLFHVPDQVEDSMAQLIQALTDPATVVRWSAAKGIGRVTERLPSVCADDVLDAILELCSDSERDNAWHGACLALAELARRGLLLPRRLSEVVPIVVRAIQFDVPRGQHSVGAHVRDAACYTCWAFARAYAPSILKPYIPQLSQSIVLASLFDREINCRRAASASFQECVGRQGADNFKHGISVLTAADYFSLGNRVDAYTSVAVYIAQFDEYRHPIIDHLFQVKLFHWDIEIRTLASKSLNNLTPLDHLYLANVVVPTLLRTCTDNNLVVRHGSVLGVAEIILALGNLSDTNSIHNNNLGLSDEVSSLVVEMVPCIEKARLYRGRGGEIMRSASSRLIECLSLARIPMSVKQQVRLLDSVDDNLKHPKEEIQIASAMALHALMKNYFPVSVNGPSERLQKRVVDLYVEKVSKEDNAGTTRGFSRALGYLPAKLLAPNSHVLDSVINSLVKAAHPKSLVGGEGDAETRRNAIESLICVCETVGIGSVSKGEVTYDVFAPIKLNQQQLDRIFDALFESMKDYNTDRRGDVGSWSRMAAMNGLEKLTYLTLNSSENNLQDDTNDIQFTAETCIKVFGAIFKQLSEKLDSVRLQAGTCLQRLLTSINPIISVSYLPCKTILSEALEMDKCIREGRNWANPSITFPLIMNVLSFDLFYQDIISGIIISVGGLTESITKASTKNFLDYLRSLQKQNETNKLHKLGNVFLSIFDDNPRNGRVILPLLKTIDKLLSHGCFNTLISDKNGTNFVRELLKRIKREANHCSDIHRLMSIVNVCLGLLYSQDENDDADDTTSSFVRNNILPYLMKLLYHRFPRIRRYTAEQIYIKILEDESIIPNSSNVETILSLLSTVPWDQQQQDDNMAMSPYGNTVGCGVGINKSILEYRNEVASLWDIALSENDLKGVSVLSGTKNQHKTKNTMVDEYESYASLVQDVGR